MKLTRNTVLITGGTSGIGLGLASELLKRGNRVVVTGRDQARLDAVKARLPALHVIKSDVSDPQQIAALYQQVVTEFPEMNMLVNNAGVMRKINLHVQSDLADLTREIDINLSGVIQMTSQFIPHLKTQQNAAIINVSSGLAFVPFPISPVYSAAKAGVHAFTQVLRIQLRSSDIKVFELAPPGTETPLFRGDFSQEDIAGVTPMDLATLVKKAIAGLERDVFEIRPGLSNVLKIMSRVAPSFILKQLGKPVDRMLAEQG